MVAVLARQMTVNGTTYPVGHRADTIGLTGNRFNQLMNLSRIVDMDDPRAARRVPNVLPTEPLFIADANGAIVGAMPVIHEPTEVPQDIPSAPAEASDVNFLVVDN